MTAPREKAALAIQGIIAALCIVAAVGYQRAHFARQQFKPELFTQHLRLPDAQVLRAATLGFRHLYADFMFLRAIQAYGAGWLKPNESREPVYQYFDRVAEVDPQFIPIYRFGNLIVADIGGDGERGQRILRKGVTYNPGSWELCYLGIYNAIWLLDRPDDGKWFLHYAERNKDTPEYVRRMGEFIERRQGRYEAAFDVNIDYFVRYQRAGNEQERMLLYNRFYDIADKWSRRHIHQGIENFQKANNGAHPKSIEEVLKPEYLPDSEIGNLMAVEATAEEAANRGLGLEESVEFVRRNSRMRVSGLPPEPKGTWYYFDSRKIERVEALDIPTSAPLEVRFPYVDAPSAHFVEMDSYALFTGAQIKSEFVKPGEPTVIPENVAATVFRADPIGGRYDWDDTNKVIISTARERMTKGREPRIGARGWGPFILPLEPSLSDFKEDFDWAVKHGVMDAEGNRLTWPAEDE